MDIRVINIKIEFNTEINININIEINININNEIVININIEINITINNEIDIEIKKYKQNLAAGKTLGSCQWSPPPPLQPS